MAEKCTNDLPRGNDRHETPIHVTSFAGGAAAGSALPVNKKLSWLFNIPRSYVLIFFLIYLTIGVSIYQDYGISWDEPVHREIASVTAKYLASIFLPGFHPTWS